MLCLFGFRLGSLEAVEVVSGEILDVGSLSEHIFLGHANIHVGRLLEEFGCARCVADDEQRLYEYRVTLCL